MTLGGVNWQRQKGSVVSPRRRNSRGGVEDEERNGRRLAANEAIRRQKILGQGDDAVSPLEELFLPLSFDKFVRLFLA